MSAMHVEHGGRLFFLLHGGAAGVTALSGLSMVEYEGGAVRLYCADVHRDGSCVRAVSFNKSAAATSTHDFSTSSGCTNWWRRYAAALRAATILDMPVSLDPYRSFVPLSSLTPQVRPPWRPQGARALHLHSNTVPAALSRTSCSEPGSGLQLNYTDSTWTIKVVVTLSFAPLQDPMTGWTHCAPVAAISARQSLSGVTQGGRS